MDNATPAPAAPAAPAQPAAPSTISATLDAANKGDFTAFDKAHEAKQRGAPLADVAATPSAPATPAAPTAEPPISRRQQDINDRIRQAVEAATRDTNAENARLRAQVGQPHAAQAPVVPAAPAAPAVPGWKRLASMPDAPKLEDFDSIPEHTAAMSLFVLTTHQREQAAATEQQSHQEQIETANRARAESFHQRLETARTADPEFVNKLTPEVRSLKPISGIGPGEPSGPLNILWEQVYDSPALDKLLLHFSAKPEELRRFESMPPHIAALPPAVRTRAHIQHIVKEFGALEKSFDASPAPSAAPASSAAAPPSTITAAPPPPPSFSRTGTSGDPQASAFARGDFEAWDRIEAEKVRARRGAA